MKTRIVIVDDHILIAKALSAILANFEQFEVLYECENGKDLQEKCKHPRNVPDVVLLDISMPIMDGFETAAWLKETYPDVLIMALSMQDDENSLIKMIKSGAKGYLLKNVHPTVLADALNHLVKNGHYYPDWAASKLFSSISNGTKQSDKKDFNDREKTFLRFSVTEMSYKEIANQMNCSTRTVEGYRDSLFEKLELKTRVGLAVYAMKNGFDT
ncbi:response regulator transcription factor [Pedobacter frigiditerrae]|uniref:response regulator transcription factor n=1 Tax=Pedobacter frigiditerrae TaxID=2530452 RepID=UPI00292DBEF1|nr:response regulator transcription factor [Pedobacter frigiditerrae]